MNKETELALLELKHRYGKEVRDRVEQMGFEIQIVTDLISRQAAIDAICKVCSLVENYHNCDGYPETSAWCDMLVALRALPSEQTDVHDKNVGKWIPFKTRPLTEEEQDEHPEWDCILDCKLPDDGQRILVSINLRGHEEVQQDEFYSDDGSYLDGGYEIGTEAVAWMPLPEPWKGEEG